MVVKNKFQITTAFHSWRESQQCATVSCLSVGNHPPSSPTPYAPPQSTPFPLSHIQFPTPCLKGLQKTFLYQNGRVGYSFNQLAVLANEANITYSFVFQGLYEHIGVYLFSHERWTGQIKDPLHPLCSLERPFCRIFSPLPDNTPLPSPPFPIFH